MKSILFVCLGNICRSPLAEAIARKFSEEHLLGLNVASAGTGDWHIDQAPCPNSVKVAKLNGLDISKFKGKQVSKADFSTYDLIVGLDDSNINNLKKLGCRHPLKLGDYGFKGADVPDPYFFDGFEGFDKVYDMIHLSVKNLLQAHLPESSL